MFIRFINKPVSNYEHLHPTCGDFPRKGATVLQKSNRALTRVSVTIQTAEENYQYSWIQFNCLN